MRGYDEETGLYYEIKNNGDRSYAVITDADKRLTGVDVPDRLGGSPVEAVGRKAFLGCKGLREVTLPECVDEIGEWAFAFCDSLSELKLASNRAVFGQGAFKNDARLEKLWIEGRSEASARMLAVVKQPALPMIFASLMAARLSSARP